MAGVTTRWENGALLVQHGDREAAAPLLRRGAGR